MCGIIHHSTNNVVRSGFLEGYEYTLSFDCDQQQSNVTLWCETETTVPVKRIIRSLKSHSEESAEKLRETLSSIQVPLGNSANSLEINGSAKSDFIGENSSQLPLDNSSHSSESTTENENDSKSEKLVLCPGGFLAHSFLACDKNAQV